MVELIGYHGTSLENARSILRDKKFHPSSDRDSLRMGTGAYFFSQMNASNEYPIMCAKGIVDFKMQKGQLRDGYGILSCRIRCEESQFLDLFEPDNLEMFHLMRYQTYEQQLRKNPKFKYKNAAVADCVVFDILRNRFNIALIRCPQFFGMFPKEEQMQLESRPYPKTYVPNVLNLCADVEKVAIDSIELVEEGGFACEAE